MQATLNDCATSLKKDEEHQAELHQQAMLAISVTYDQDVADINKQIQ